MTASTETPEFYPKKKPKLFIDSRISSITIQRGPRIWLHPDLIFYSTNYGKEYKKHLSVLHGFTEKVIQERKLARKDRRASTPNTENDVGTKKREAFLDLLLEASGDGQSAKLTDLELREEVDTFMFEVNQILRLHRVTKLVSGPEITNLRLRHCQKADLMFLHLSFSQIAVGSFRVKSLIFWAKNNFEKPLQWQPMQNKKYLV